MRMIDQIIAFNKEFVAQKGYEKYLTDKYPDKKLAVLSCMDTRLTELLPAALGLKNGDAKIIKNAGGLVISAFDSAMRSLIVAIYELGVEEIMVVAHSHCGACHMSYDHFHHEIEIVNILCDEKYLAEDGKPDVEKMELITFDPVHHTYIQLGKTVGNAFSDGKQLK